MNSSPLLGGLSDDSSPAIDYSLVSSPHARDHRGGASSLSRSRSPSRTPGGPRDRQRARSRSRSRQQYRSRSRSIGRPTPMTPTSGFGSPASRIGPSPRSSSPGRRRSHSRSRGRSTSPFRHARHRTPRAGGAASPYVRRGEVQPGRRYRDVVQPMDLQDDDDDDEKKHLNPSSTPHNVVENVSEVWGTQVNIHKSKAAFEKFFKEFTLPNSDEPLYIRLLDECVNDESLNVNLNCANLRAFDPELYRELVDYPSELVPLFDLVVNEFKERLFVTTEEQATFDRIEIRPFNLFRQTNMRDLDPSDIDKLISVKGMVLRVGEIIPEMKDAFFECTRCDHHEVVIIEDGSITEPTTCVNCEGKHSFMLVHNRSSYADMQLIKVQETPDDIPEGQTPHTVLVYAFGELVDVAKPGDRVKITGVFKARSVRVNRNIRSIRSIYKTHVDAIHFQKMDASKYNDEDASAAPNADNYTSFDEHDALDSQVEAENRAIREMGNDEDIYEMLTRSVAPSIYGMDDIKKGVLCLLFGGTNSELGAGHGRTRGEINVLLCGDPGVAKSQLMQYVHKLAPRGIYTSGKGSSAVGLTAYVTKDPETREFVLESGALVLSDRGVCCIDEFDKMSDSTRSILHEVMEQQTVSIAKAGIVCSLNARTSILASANPIESRYNPDLSVVQNIKLGPTLLSRFDLIYLILDQPNELQDRRLAKHLVSLYYDVVPESKFDVIPLEKLTKYISYARKHVQPQISDEAAAMLIERYVSIRSMGGKNGGKKVITATPRQLEALIRLSEAVARMRLSDIVTVEDVAEANRLMAVATLRAATDQKTGKIDMGAITTGRTSEDQARLEYQMRAVLEVLENGGKNNRMAFAKVLTSFNEQSDIEITRTELRDALEELTSEGKLKIEKRGHAEFVHVLN